MAEANLIRDIQSQFNTKKRLLGDAVTYAKRAHDLVELSNTAKGAFGLPKHHTTFTSLKSDLSAILRRKDASTTQLIGPSLRLGYAAVESAHAVYGAATTAVKNFPAKYGEVGMNQFER